MPKGHAWLSLFLFLLLGAAAKKKDAAPLRYPRSPPPPASPPPSPTPKVDKTAEAGIHPLVAFGPHPVSNDAEFGLLIDAGSTGSRLHVYEWPKRVFSTLPPPISHPLTSELWTKRRAPGISSLADDPKAAAETLLPLIEHAKVLLRHYKADWHRFPIWVKATAGMRALPHTPRRAIIEEVRALLLSERNPFFFVEADSARVISGEEEAGYAWTGINFALGHLLEDGTGSGTARPTRAVGIVEMGGASSQVSFINPGHDIIENLFKVQVGGLKHWNIYARSFLHYGAYSAMQRMWNELALAQGCFEAGADMSTPCVVQDACVPLGTPPMALPPTVTNQTGVVPPSAYAPVRQAILVPAPDLPSVPRFARCYAQLVQRGSSLGLQGDEQQPFAGYTEGATRRRFNEWCDWAHHGQCAMTDVYLPLLPDASDTYGDFHLLGSSLVDTFQALGVPQHSTLRNLSAAATKACGLSMKKLVKRVHKRQSASDFSQADDAYVPDLDLPGDVNDAEAEGEDEDGEGEAAGGQQLRAVSKELLEKLAEAAAESSDEKTSREICFKAALTIAMLNNGFGVQMDRKLFATDIIRTAAGNKLKAGWTLGAILFEINSLPWTYKPDSPDCGPAGAKGEADADSSTSLQPHPPIKVDPPANVPAAVGEAAGGGAAIALAVGQGQQPAPSATVSGMAQAHGTGSASLQQHAAVVGGSLRSDAVSLGMMALGVSAAFALVMAAVMAGVARLRGTDEAGAASGEDSSFSRRSPLLDPPVQAEAGRRPYEHLLPTDRRKVVLRG